MPGRPIGRALQRARASVRFRVTLLAAGAFALTFFVAAAVLLRSLEDGLVDDMRRANSSALEAEAVALQATAALPPGVVFETRDDDVLVAQWTAVSGQPIVYAFPPGYAATDAPQVISGSARAAQPSLALSVIQAEGAGTAALATTRVAGSGVLATISPLDHVRDAIDRTTTLLWAVGPALVALVAALAWLLAGRALRPVRVMTRRVSEIESHSLHERVADPGSADEIAALARTMNEMLGRLEAANASSRRLVSDASHELRTPIAVMRTELEVAEREATAGGADWTATGGVLLGELDRLGTMVDDLLLLARSDEVAARGPDRRADGTSVDGVDGVDRVDRVELVDVAHDAAGRRRRADVDVRVVVEPGATGLTVPGDRGAVERAVDHVVSNAARSAATRVDVRVEHAGDAVAVHVDDDGPGIPADRRDAVVQRFVRLDEGRSRDAGGAGLGLAVASEVAARHGGRLIIGDAPLGGARVSILLPRAEAGSATMVGDDARR